MAISLNNFLNLNDRQLYQMAEYQTALDADQKKLTKNSVIYGIPLMDSFARAAVKDGGLSAKTTTFAGRMVGWVGFFALASIYNTALDSVKNRIPAVKKFEENHPVMSTTLNVLGLWVAMDYAHKGVKKLTEITKNKYPDVFDNIDYQKQNILNKLDNSWVDKRIYKPVSGAIKYMEKHFPEATIGLKTVLPWVAPLVVATLFTKSLCMVNDMREKTQRNFEKLKNMQLGIKEQLG